MTRRPVFEPVTFHSGGTMVALMRKLARRNFEVWFWRVLFVSWLILRWA